VGSEMCIRDRNKPVQVPATQVIWVQKIIDAIYASSKAKREVPAK